MRMVRYGNGTVRGTRCRFDYSSRYTYRISTLMFHRSTVIQLNSNYTFEASSHPSPVRPGLQTVPVKVLCSFQHDGNLHPFQPRRPLHCQHSHPRRLLLQNSLPLLPRPPHRLSHRNCPPSSPSKPLLLSPRWHYPLLRQRSAHTEPQENSLDAAESTECKYPNGRATETRTRAGIFAISVG